MRINTRLRMSAVIILGLLLLMTAALIWSARATTVVDANAALAAKLQKSASDRVLVRDDYLLRQSERARIQWETETEAFRSLLAQARDQLPAADQTILDGIESDFTATVSIFHQIVAIKEMRLSAGVDSLSSPEGEQRLISQLLLRAYSLNDGVRQLRDTTQAAASAAHTLLEWLMFSIMVVIVITTLVNSSLIQRLLTRRIEQLREGMDLIGAGHLDHRIPVAGNDELSDLASAGNAMAARLMETTTSVENLQREVAERMRVEGELRAVLEELATTLHSIGDAVISTDLEGRIRQMNPVAERLTGWVEAEGRGRPLEEVFWIIQEETREVVKNPAERVLREGVVIGLANHTLLIDRGGVEHPIADSGAPIRGEDNATVGVVLVFRDQTQERAAEKELHELMERQQAILAAVPDIIMEVDRDKIYTWANQAGQDFFGKDVIGHEAADYFEGEEDVYGVVQPLFNGNSPAVYVESWQRRKDGQIRLLAWWCRSLTDNQGNVTGALSSAQDITERKQLEKETAKARSDFLYAVSHELKTPLFLMTATMEMMKSQAEEERRLQFLAQEETWARNLARLRLLINNLVDSQRPTTLGTQLSLTPTDLAGLVRQAVEDLDVFAVKQSITWQIDLDPLPDLPLDSEAIERTLHNLLSNAIKFSPPGSAVQIRLRAQPNSVVLEVEDHGKGIPATEMSRLFQPFARSSGAVKAVIPGTGLGLYVSKILVEGHGGSISLRSEEGMGTTVTVSLPVRE